MIEFLKKRIKSLFSGSKRVESVEPPVRANHHYKHKHIEEKQKQKSHPRKFEQPPVSGIKNIKAGQNVKQKLPTFDIKPKRTPQKPDKLVEIPQEEGKTITVELIERLKKIDGVKGIHIMPVGWEAVLPEIVTRRP